jgi:hypothetical protein
MLVARLKWPNFSTSRGWWSIQAEEEHCGNVHSLPKNRRNVIMVSGIVMSTIFCNFCQLSAKNLAFFLKANVMIQILRKPAVLYKNTNFCQFLGAKIFFKIITSVPGQLLEVCGALRQPEVLRRLLRVPRGARKVQDPAHAVPLLHQVNVYITQSNI